jgi:hypothetical protein
MKNTNEILIPYGYTWCNGIILNKYHTDKYNYYTREIDRYSINPVQFADKIESLKNKRHEFIVNCFDIYKSPKGQREGV